MKRNLLVLLSICLMLNLKTQAQENTNIPDRTIFVYGTDIRPKFVQYVVDLVDKPDPRICYVPTASADNKDNIEYWNYICKVVGIEPHVLKVWIESPRTDKTFEEILLNMDAIVVGGGNTLNMMGIWKAQEIDVALKKALEKGIILSGGSAGSICWFENGISDSRPIQYSIVNGLGFLPFSHCPHYNDPVRKELYHEEILHKNINAGYAVDDYSGLLFKNGKLIEAVSLNEVNNSYYITLKNGSLETEQLKSRILIGKHAIGEDEYQSITVNKKLKGFPEILKQDNPLDSYISFLYVLANGKESKIKELSSQSLKERLADNMPDKEVDENRRNSFLNKQIDKVLIYNDSVAGIINKYDGFYGVFNFYKENGKWLNAGEDIGGDTVLEAEIYFREKASQHLQNVRDLQYVK